MKTELSLTPDEIQECIDALNDDHPAEDYEPECYGCNARVKLIAMLAKPSEAA